MPELLKHVILELSERHTQRELRYLKPLLAPRVPCKRAKLLKPPS